MVTHRLFSLSHLTPTLHPANYDVTRVLLSDGHFHKASEMTGRGPLHPTNVRCFKDFQDYSKLE